MKRFALFFLILALLAALAACGETPDTETTTTVETMTAPGSAASEPPPQTEAPTDPVVTTTEEPTEPVLSTTEDDGFRDVTLLDDDLCRMMMYAVYRVSYNDTENWVIWFELENRSDKYLYFDLTDVCCFDCMLDAGLSEQVDPGETRASELILEGSELSIAGIREVDELNFTLSLYDREDPEAYYTEDFTLLTTQRLSISPTDRAADEVTPPELPIGEDAVLLAETEGWTCWILRAGPDEFGGYALLLWAENRTEGPLDVTLSELCLNGIQVSSYTYGDMTVLPGKHAFRLVELTSGSMTRIGLESDEIEQLSAVLWVTDAEGEALARDPFTCTFTEEEAPTEEETEP